jgi:transposase
MGTPVEADELYIGGRRKQTEVKDNKTPLLAALEVGGHVRTQVVAKAVATTILPFLLERLYDGAILHTDESKSYHHKEIQGRYSHSSVRHIAKEFVSKSGVTTNHVEGFFGNFRRVLDGTYHCVSPRYLGSYAAEFAFRYNHRHEGIFELLLTRAVKQA